MELRRWQKKVIDEFPDIIKNYKKFILKAPTGAGKTVLASEIINKFYKGKKIVVLCHRLVLLEQLEKGLSSGHKVKKLGLSEEGVPFKNYDVLISTNLRSRDFLQKAIKDCDLLIIDEAHRVSPNGQAYKELLDQFDKESRAESKLLGLTASPERRTGDQRDQLGLAFDAIIDCADIEELIKEGVLVPAEYRSFFIHDLELENMDISTGDFPIEQLSNAIIKSSMIEYAINIYLNQKTKMKDKPISAWFCPDILVAEETKKQVSERNLKVELITAKTPIKERLEILKKHEDGDLECLISVGVLSEGWDNPNCNMIVHLRPTLSKVFWGQSVGRGLRSSKGKEKCIVIDVSSNFTTFGPVEKLKWKLMNHRKSYLEFKNRFNWVSKQQFVEDRDYTYLLCEGLAENGRRCSLVYKKKIYRTIHVLSVTPMHLLIFIKIIKLKNQKMIIVFIKYFLKRFQKFSQI
jgi:superfamily II DNA or RNA helicase